MHTIESIVFESGVIVPIYLQSDRYRSQDTLHKQILTLYRIYNRIVEEDNWFEKGFISHANSLDDKLFYLLLGMLDNVNRASSPRTIKFTVEYRRSANERSFLSVEESFHATCTWSRDKDLSKKRRKRYTKKDCKAFVVQENGE